ncbi:hypothetical protein SAMN05216369_2712 [Marinobacter antarcticus]|uniref:SoxXA-binding protein SoxK n=1 Tax=Marinobacter antarcticus TaxID=564117 RepID=A0A1M6UAX1_9GAMM|nr:hypothetical protein [Marinobacter antarcticus]SHK66327.1 hypothetical protein SAMN05216369_2712 [Marinobacter antarcticus]
MNKLLPTFGAIVVMGLTLSVQAGPKEDFQEIYSKAESTHKDSGTYQWTTTSDRLKAASSAAESGDYKRAKTMASEALRLAEESVAQRKQQGKVWRNVAIGG